MVRVLSLVSHDKRSVVTTDHPRLLKKARKTGTGLTVRLNSVRVPVVWRPRDPRPRKHRSTGAIRIHGVSLGIAAPL
jgi:hypothetical protein